MATQAANATPPAGEDETETTDAEETEVVETEDDADPPDDATVEAEAAAAAKAAEEAEAAGKGKPKDDDKPDDEEEADEPVAAKAVKDLTVEELAKELPEDTLRRLGQKFANKTMAAARRAERDTEVAKSQNERVTAELTTYKEWAGQFKTAPMTALRRVLGPELTFKQFAEMVAKDPGTAEPPKVDPQVAELKRRLDEKERQERERAVAENTRASQQRVWDALGAEPDRFDLVTTDIGKGQLWDAIVAYHGKYGSCPDDKVFAMADVIEKRLEEQVAKSKKFARPAQKATPATNKPAVAAKGKTITNKSSAGAPAVRANPTETEAERDARINAEMRAAGELS